MVARFDPTASKGVVRVHSICIEQLGWIFREQMVDDYGIDAHIELVENNEPTGKLAAVQIKTGPSHVRETESAYVFRGTPVHLDYWTNHSLPVLLVLHLPESQATYWVQVTLNRVIRTGKSWTIDIPKTNRFGADSKDALRAVFEGSPAQQRMRKLALDEPLMRHIRKGGKLSVELEDWINKSLGRSPVKLFLYDDDGHEILERQWHVFYTGFEPKGLAEAIFPWATARIDKDFYADNEDDEDYDAASLRAVGIDEREFTRPRTLDEVYPYAVSSGEVAYYRLQLFIAPLGEAYLAMANYAANGQVR